MSYVASFPEYGRLSGLYMYGAVLLDIGAVTYDDGAEVAPQDSTGGDVALISDLYVSDQDGFRVYTAVDSNAGGFAFKLIPWHRSTPPFN